MTHEVIQATATVACCLLYYLLFFHCDIDAFCHLFNKAFMYVCMYVCMYDTAK